MNICVRSIGKVDKYPAIELERSWRGIRVRVQFADGTSTERMLDRKGRGWFGRRSGPPDFWIERCQETRSVGSG